jgi:hypothetical protein
MRVHYPAAYIMPVNPVKVRFHKNTNSVPTRNTGVEGKHQPWTVRRIQLSRYRRTARLRDSLWEEVTYTVTLSVSTRRLRDPARFYVIVYK